MSVFAYGLIVHCVPHQKTEEENKVLRVNNLKWIGMFFGTLSIPSSFQNVTLRLPGGHNQKAER
jgi:hypothetical protein